MAVDRKEGSGGRRGRILLADAAILLFLCTAFYWKIILSRQYTYLDSPDLAYQVLPWLQYQAAELHRGHIPLWDPHLWGGQPLIGQAQPGTAYPLNWILFALPLRDGFVRQTYLHWYLLFIHFMAAWFAYLLCRDLGRSRGASILGGAVFSLGGWLAQNNLPQMVNSAVWTPLVFLFLLRSLREERPVANAALSGAFFGMAWLGGHHQIPIFVGLAAAALWTWHIFRQRRTGWRALKAAAVFVVFCGLVGGLQLLPAQEYGRLAKRWVGAREPKAWNEPVPYTVQREYSLQASSLVGLVIPGHGKHVDPHLGVVALSLALLGVARRWGCGTVRLMTAVAGGGLLFSLGQSNVFHGLIYAVVPLVEKARTPAFAIYVYQFAMAILAAYGADSFRNEVSAGWQRRASLALAAFGALVLLTGSVLALLQKAPGDDRYLVTALAALLGAAVLHGWEKGHLPRGIALAAALALAMIELANVSTYYWPNREEVDRPSFLRNLRQDRDLAQFLKTLPGPLRCEMPETEIPYNFGDWYGIDQFGGYTASLPVNLLRVPWTGQPGRQLFGINCVVAKASPGPEWPEVFRSARGLGVYWDPQRYPRAWVVHEARRIGNVSEIGRLLNDDSLDLRRTAVLQEAPPSLESCAGGDEVRVVERSAGRVALEARMGCRGMVVLGDSYFPGWKATVDGRPARIWEAYTAVRGVVVEAGTHRIEMVYQPLSVKLGLAMTLAGWLGVAILAWGSRRKEP